MTEEISPTTARAPSGGPSLYVGDLDPNIREQQLLDLFRGCGTVLGVRICRDVITQRSLGYGYVNFQNAPDAERALETLNFHLLGDRHIRLMWQQRDPSLRYSGSGNLFVKNLEEATDSKGLHDLFKKFGTILSCKVMQDENGKSRRYGFVHFKEEKAADDAIEGLKDTKVSDNESLYLAHFVRRNARIAALLANFTNVYIKQVLPTVDKDAIERFFSKFGGITSAVAKKDAKGRIFAFCNFSVHDDAVKCIENFHDHMIEGLTAPGEKIYVQRAQPRSERLVELRQKYMQRQSLGNNLYVRNFDSEFGDENLRDLFKEFGEIKSCRIMVDAKGASRGFGFVSFHTAEQANTALREMNGRMLNGKPLVVNVAQRRDQRHSMLQVQFQQRMQALLRQIPLLPFVAAGMPPPMSMPRKQPARSQHQNPQRPTAHRTHVGSRRQEQHEPLSQQPQQPYTVPRTPQQPAAMPDTPPMPPISADDLASMSADDQKTALGDRLYVKIAEITQDHAPKITGMFLELDPMDVLSLLDNPTKLSEKVEEALCVLRAHQLGK